MVVDKRTSVGRETVPLVDRLMRSRTLGTSPSWGWYWCKSNYTVTVMYMQRRDEPGIPVRQVRVTVSVPVMTRLRPAESQVLDLLIEGGIARSRSEALAWCVRLVAQHEADWLEELRAAAARMAEIRERGPDC